MNNWKDIQQNSFYESLARERAIGLVDEGTFQELCGPEQKFCSTHLDAMNEPSQFDDGVVTGVGKIGQHPVFVISQEGTFIGGAVGEVHGAKIVKTLQLAGELYSHYEKNNANELSNIRPIVILSFDTGGVRLHEANAGLLAHSEIMDALQLLRKKVPVIGLSGGKVGAFGGMGFVAAATDIIIMSPKGRIGLTGPEVIEQEMGHQEFNSSDRALVYRTTGGKHKYIVGDCDFLVEDTISAFYTKVSECLLLSMEEIEKIRKIGSYEHIKQQMKVIDTIQPLGIKDSRDLWCFAGNQNVDLLIDMSVSKFLDSVSRLTI